ncbi:transmembrane protein, putative [Medicago truncatula]|uniref:Transmembrane protein, putative n=1 Tax=Medicago truncatula TaxID=3880 RepID=A0A072UU54_MEDTR|nr:transmembrane protein, putative [Medicago truncatula]
MDIYSETGVHQAPTSLIIQAVVIAIGFGKQVVCKIAVDMPFSKEKLDIAKGLSHYYIADYDVLHLREAFIPEDSNISTTGYIYAGHKECYTWRYLIPGSKCLHYQTYVRDAK